MSALPAVSCRQCGGAVQASPGKPLPACLFCGAPATELVALQPREAVEAPREAISFTIEEVQAREAFRAFASSSFWTPREVREARLELRRLWLPAWSFGGRVETHWAGLVTAFTSSGKRPVAGVAEQGFDQVLIPASATLTQAELRALGPYQEALEPFDPDTASEPFEVSDVSRSAARAAAVAEMQRRHAAALKAEHGLVQLRASARVLEPEGRPVLVPVYIGAYRYGDHPWRVIVNGQTGQISAEAPLDVRKIALVAGLGVLVLALVLAAVGAALVLA